jgi:hypothetical protein
MKLLPRLQRVESLIKQALARASSALIQIANLITGVGTPVIGTIIPLANDGVSHNIVSVDVSAEHPIIIEVTFMVRDPSIDRDMWQTVRSEVNGGAAPVIVATANEFLIVQPGMANPPLVGAPTLAGTIVSYNITNPLAGNPVNAQAVAMVRTGIV